MLRGIDVSSYQSSSYDTTGLSFVFIKATEGRTYTNPKLAAQTKTARDAAISSSATTTSSGPAT